MSHLAKDVFGYPSCEEAFDVLLDSRVHVIKEHIVSVPCSTSSHATCSSAVDSEADDGDSTAENWETQFARYRLDCTKDAHQLIDVDSHLHPLLATSSICVLQKRKKYENPLPTSVQDMLRKLLLEKRLEKFDAQIAAAIRDIVMVLSMICSGSHKSVPYLLLGQDYEGENASKTEARIKHVQFFMEQAAWKPSGQGSRRY
ncbi:hypothetical protein BCR43DRAFT_262139 [Syncephalastrum racemosum]|uniref:Uncharacterized protein n=1 Tax=Syncephalastrum racemosum TaxID=13706 RepID=A0A1X2HI54_SYNRA|nr:hypothetical protein BCR43DRAFT_262139 [Syncephalastrum racemosum]